MIPLQPRSIKFTKEQQAKLKTIAHLLHWSEAEVLRCSIDCIHAWIHAPTSETPTLVRMARESLKDMAPK